MAAHACEHQGADMQLQHEFSGWNKCRQLMGRHQLELDTNFGRLSVSARTGLDEE